MTRILLHPDRLPRYAGARAFMPDPWRWWETRAYHTADGNQVELEHDLERLEYRVTFGRDGASTILTDPPAARLLSVTVYDDRYYTGLGRTFLENQYVLCRVVWHEQPGPDWQPLPTVTRTCCPGNYLLDSEVRGASERGPTRRSADDFDFQTRSFRGTFMQTMPLLRWPITPTIRTEPDDEFAAARRFSQEQITGIYGVPAGLIAPDEVREREGLPELVSYSLTAGPGEYDRVVFGDGTEIPLTVPVTLAARGVVVVTVPAGAGDGGTPLRMTEVRDWGGHLIGVLQEPSVIRGGRSPSVLPESEVINEIDRLEDYFDTRDEAEAAIRLVNDQVRHGPRDDYNANRYDKCQDCGHDWHGLECGRDNCDCLNTDWVKS
jgi:hypothetical protein